MKEYTDCTEVREELSALLDEELSAEEQTAIEHHLTDCGECRRELEALQQVSDLYGNLPAQSAPDNLVASIHEELESSTIEFDPESRMTRPVSYRPVIMAAAILAMMAGVSYFASQGLGGARYAEDMMAETPAVIQSDAMSIEEKEAEYWGDDAPQTKIARQSPLASQLDMNSPEAKLRQQLLEEMKSKRITITFSDDAESKPSRPGRKSAEELTNEFTISEDGLWIEKGYTDQELTILKPGTNEYVNLLFDRPYLKNLTRHTRDIIFSYQGKWYRIAHEGPLMRDPILGDPHPKSRKLSTTVTETDN